RIDVVVVVGLVDAARSHVTDIQHKLSCEFPLDTQVVLSRQRQVNCLVIRRIEAGPCLCGWVEVARRKRQGPFQERSLQTVWIVRAGAEADRVRIGLAFLHSVDELVAADTVVEDAEAAPQGQTSIGGWRPGKSDARSE